MKTSTAHPDSVLIRRGASNKESVGTMKTKVTFETYDEILGSAVRGIAAQVAGYQTARGNTNIMLMLGSFDFDFANEEQARRFEKAVRTYIAPQFQDGIKIEIAN